MTASRLQEYNKELAKWYELSLGKDLLKDEAILCREFLSHLFGYHLVQLGLPHIEKWTECSAIKNRICLQALLSSDSPSPFKMVITDFAELPLRPDSVDLIFLPHCLEACTEREYFLKQIVDCLIAEGHLLILCFNYRGLWWLRKFLYPRQAPWSGKAMRMRKLRRILTELGCDIKLVKTTFHQPPIMKASWRKRFNFFEQLSRLCLPNSGAVYGLLAKKKISLIKPVGKAWQKSTILVKSSVTEPTTRVNSGNSS